MCVNIYIFDMHCIVRANKEHALYFKEVLCFCKAFCAFHVYPGLCVNSAFQMLHWAAVCESCIYSHH